jgi:sporulation protein YunB
MSVSITQYKGGKMKYYTKRSKGIKFKKITFIIIAIIIIFNLIVYFFDSRVFPSVLQISEVTVKAKTTEIINETSIELFDDEFKYNEMIIVEKDSQDNITLIRVNTVKLNELTSKLSLECNRKLVEMGDVGIDVPLGWVSNNSAFYHLGPKIKVKVEPIGNMKVTYDSKFESAGINQTRHKIYLNLEAKIRIIVPLHSQNIEVVCEIPIAETILPGKIPSTAIDFGASK